VYTNRISVILTVLKTLSTSVLFHRKQKLQAYIVLFKNLAYVSKTFVSTLFLKYTCCRKMRDYWVFNGFFPLFVKRPLFNVVLIPIPDPQQTGR